MIRRAVTCAAMTAVLLAGCQDSDEVIGSFDNDGDSFPYTQSVDVVGTLVVDYCTYGAASIKQLEECLYPVSAADIEPLDTQAASYALTGQRARSTECGDEAGPFCGPGAKQDEALEKALGLSR